MSSPAFYVWIKAGHVAAVLAFIGGLLATEVTSALLPLLGTSAAVGARQLSRWNRRLTAPALLLTWIFGLFRSVSGGWVPQLWLTIKHRMVCKTHQALIGHEASFARTVTGIFEVDPVRRIDLQLSLMWCGTSR
ncbi:hypothetical protein [Paraburkholderia phytofirmans]|uniref:hypothetical protein n=1 Tax=Paraburkholderia phytofirmans TaxID=261302 RepID=UPI0038BB6955